MNKKELVDLLDEFKSGLLSKATDGDIQEKFYSDSRQIIIDNISPKDKIPKFIRSNRNSSEFRRYMQTESSNYAGRRKIISESMNELINYVEENNNDPDPFAQLKQFRQIEEIGSGGFGTVYKYRNECLEMDFAVKIYSPIFVSSEAQKEGEKRFFREAKMMFSLNHPNIVKLYDAGRIDEGPFIRMEYIEGYNLCKLQEKCGVLTFKQSKSVIIQLLEGLEYAHQKDIIHRDLKPSNVVFAESEKLFKIIDFGVSAFLDAEKHTKLTKTGEIVAGGAFVDPLLNENPKLRDKRTDIYSVGAIWYWLLSGRPPQGSNMKQYLAMISPELDNYKIDMIMKCLSGEIEDRYESCVSLSEIIKRLS